MIAPIAAMLAGGGKGFFEDPAYLIGIPLLALGAIGLLVFVSPLGRARPGSETEPDASGAPNEDSSGSDR
jgi:hypothetical protein